jgi:LuxR family maltose regulon positive regulatory protein
LHAAIARVLAGDLNGALEPLQLAYESAAHSPLDNVAYDATAVLALVHAVAGETRRAETWLRRNLALPLPGTWVAPHTRRSADAARRLIALDRLEVEPVTGDDAPFDHRVNELWPLTTFADALHATLAGMPLEALDLIDRARAAHRDWLDHGAVATPLLVAAEVDALLVTGRGNEARRVLATAPDSDPMLQVSQARLALLTGQPHAARRLAADSTWTRRATVRHRLEMLLIHAVAAARTGDRDAATERIGRAVDGVRMTGAVRILTTVARAELAPLLDAAPGAADVLAEPSLADAADLFPAGVTLIELTRGEGRVLDLLARGLTLQQVADTLVVSYNTVKTQQRSLYRKLGTNSRPDAIARARHLGLI